MKKRVVLIALLIAVAAGMVFAQSGRSIPFTTYADSRAGSVTITRVEQSPMGVTIAYNCKPANSYVEVEFTFTAYYQDGSSKTWTNTESWLGPRTNSTWRFALTSASKVQSINISWTRTNPSMFNP